MQLTTLALPVLLAASSALSAAALPLSQPPLPPQPQQQQQQLDSRAATYRGGQMTYYTGDSLRNPACGGPSPNDGSMAVAVSRNSPAKCNQWITISYQGKSVRAKVVDHCGGCGRLDIDGTKGVFRRLAPLDKGRLYGISMSM